jgi:hypothetical protein
MPRPCSRRYLPYLKMLKAIALDEQQPTALRVRSAELSVAILSGEWSVASSRATRKAVRGVIAADAIDQRLLEVSGIQQDLEQRNDAPAFAEQKGNEMELQHEQQRNKLQAILADSIFSDELKEAVRKQLSGLDATVQQPEPAVEPAPEPTAAQKLQDIKAAFDHILAMGDAKAVELAATEDEREKVCGHCLHRQAITTAACQLCAEIPENWLVPSAMDSEQKMLSQKTGLSLSELRMAAANPSWAGAPGRMPWLVLQIQLREKSERRARRETECEANSEVRTSVPTDAQVRSASRFYESEIERLSKEQN